MQLPRNIRSVLLNRLPLTTFAIGMLATVIVTVYLGRMNAERYRERCFYIASSYAFSLSSAINNPCSSLYIFQELFASSRELPAFERVSERLLTLYPYIRTLEVAPDGIIRRVYPLEGNSITLGYNLFEHVQLDQFLSKTHVQLDGPLNLIQGQTGIVGRLPLHVGTGKDTQFWGFVCITFNFSDVLHVARLDTLAQWNVAYELWTLDAPQTENRIIAASQTPLSENPVTQTIALPDRTWELRLSPANGWTPSGAFWTRFLSGLLLSCLFTLLAKTVVGLLETKRRLEILSHTDSLTGLPNRLSLEKHFMHLQQGLKKWDLAICFIDLNGFKQVNDTLGHRSGDALLMEFASRLREGLQEQDMAARFGGDEFVLLLQAPRGGIPARVTEVLAPTLQPFRLDGTPCTVWGSVGVAIVSECQTFEEVLRLADEAMYRAKAAPGRGIVFADASSGVAPIFSLSCDKQHKLS